MAFGFEAYRSNGSTLISSKGGVARLVYSADFAETFTGTRSIPAFNSNLGYYQVRMYPFIHRIRSGTGYAPLAENAALSQSGKPVISVCPLRQPTLSWNNSTKVMTFTANAETENYYHNIARYRYRLIMVHYK